MNISLQRFALTKEYHKVYEQDKVEYEWIQIVISPALWHTVWIWIVLRLKETSLRQPMKVHSSFLPRSRFFPVALQNFLAPDPFQVLPQRIRHTLHQTHIHHNSPLSPFCRTLSFLHRHLVSLSRSNGQRRGVDPDQEVHFGHAGEICPHCPLHDAHRMSTAIDRLEPIHRKMILGVIGFAEGWLLATPLLAVVESHVWYGWLTRYILLQPFMVDFLSM